MTFCENFLLYFFIFATRKIIKSQNNKIKKHVQQEKYVFRLDEHPPTNHLDILHTDQHSTVRVRLLMNIKNLDKNQTG